MTTERAAAQGGAGAGAGAGGRGGGGGGGAGRPLLLGPLARRLLAAFVLVAVAAVALVTGAAIVGTGRGLDTASAQARQEVAGRAAAALAVGYRRAGGWDGADLGPAQAIAQAAGARLAVLDTEGRLASGTRMGAGMGRGAVLGAGARVVSAPVAVDGREVGTARLVFATAASTTARQVAGTWILAAAAAAVTLAVVAGWLVLRRLSRPLASVAATARAFAAGDRSARTGLVRTDEVGDVGHALDELADAVERSEQGRRRLAADVAHELRTPLAALQAGLEEARDGLVPTDAARLAALHDQSLRLGRIVDDLAALSSAESGALRLRLAPVDLAELARREAAAQEARLRAAGLVVHLDLDTPLPVSGDGDRLRQVVGNLLANAARYCRPGDTVTLRAAAGPGRAVLTVTDSGPGIPAAELPYVFDRLWRGHAGDRVRGSGIGLAVVRELVTAHAGTVGVRSEPGVGTAFDVELPLRAG